MPHTKKSHSFIQRMSRETVIPISIGLLISLVAGVFFLGFQVSVAKHTLTDLENAVERATNSRWTFLMERESWKDYKNKNPSAEIPDVKAIREAHLAP